MKPPLSLGLGLALISWLVPPGLAADLNQQLNIQPQHRIQVSSQAAAEQWMATGHQRAEEGDLTQATQAWTAAAEMYRQLGESEAEGRAYGLIGAAYARLGQYPQAERALGMRITVARNHHDRLGQVYGLNNLGTLRLHQGRVEEGQTLFEEALGLARQTGDGQAMGLSLSNLGLVATQRGDLEAAARWLEVATNYRFLAGDRLGEANSSNNLGDVYRALGRESNAIGAYRVALRTGREAQDRDLQLRALDGLLAIYLGQGDMATAADYLDHRMALTLDGPAPDPETTVTLRWLGDYYYQMGQLDSAQTAYAQGLGLARSLEHKPLEAELTNRLLRL
ncbi:MAG: tetratricopeptide repeat protein [Nodosilinea sp.]